MNKATCVLAVVTSIAVLASSGALATWRVFIDAWPGPTHSTIAFLRDPASFASLRIACPLRHERPPRAAAPELPTMELDWPAIVDVKDGEELRGSIFFGDDDPERPPYVAPVYSARFTWKVRRAREHTFFTARGSAITPFVVLMESAPTPLTIIIDSPSGDRLFRAELAAVGFEKISAVLKSSCQP